MIRRGFAVLAPAIFQPLYSAMVHPKLCFTVHASCLYLQEDIKLIERMQRLATRCLKSLRKLPYLERLHVLKIPSMERPFRRATLITVYKLCHGYLTLPAEEFFEPAAAGYLRGQNFQSGFLLTKSNAALKPMKQTTVGCWKQPRYSSVRRRLNI